MTIYIYGLHCPIADCIRYVGKTKKPKARLWAHFSNAVKPTSRYHAAHWMRGLIEQGLRPSMVILEELDDSEDWAEYERFYIANGADFGWKLTNFTPGGEGGGFLREEDKEAWRLAVNASLARTEVREKISAGVKASSQRPGLKEKQRARFKQKWTDPAYRERMAEMSRVLMQDPKLRESRRQQGLIRYADPAARAYTAEQLKDYYATEEGKANKKRTSCAPAKVEANRQAQLKNWQDPAYRAANHAAKTTPEVIEKQKQGAKNQWADPEIRARMVAALRIGAAKRREKRLAAKMALAETTEDQPPCA